MHLLFIADTNNYSHDLKWIYHFSQQTDQYVCFLISQKHQLEKLTNQDKSLIQKNNVVLLESIEYFSLKHFYRTKKNIRYLNRVIHEYRIDLIHIHYAEPHALWALMRKTFDCPMILTTRGTDILRSISEVFTKKQIINIILARLYKKALNNFDVITCTSQKQKEVLATIVDNIKKISIIRTGVNIEVVLASNKINLNEGLKDKKYVLFPRSMKPLYNHEFSIRAIAELNTAIREDYLMVFLNADSPEEQYKAQIEAMLDEEGLCYLFLNNQPPEELYGLYYNAALVVMNPWSDGTPVTALEAMLCKTPVIVGPAEYDKDLFEGTVHQLAEWDENELTQLITSVLENENNGDFLENSKQRVLDLADRKNEMKKLEEIYSDLYNTN